MTQALEITRRPVLITTAHRGVFFGYLEFDIAPASVTLTSCRCAIRFGTEGGFLELADTGPTSSSKIGSRAERVTLYDITSVTSVTEKARKAWEAA